MNVVKQRVGILVGLFVFALPASGHHTFPVFYNTSQKVEVEGEVTEILWSNPHVSFFIRTSDGEDWKIESNSPTSYSVRRLRSTPGRSTSSRPVANIRLLA